MAREIIKTNEAAVGFDFTGSPIRGNNLITTTFDLIINSGDEYEKINSAVDSIQKVN